MPARATVGMPVYNGEKYLPAALDSVREQDEADLEIVISDNASTDATEEICRAAAAEDPRIRYVRLPENWGGRYNFNHVLDLATAPYFTWAAADDIRRPAFVRRCLETFADADPATVLVSPRTQIIDAGGVITEDLNDADLACDEPTPHQRMAHFLNAQAAHLFYGLHRTDALRRTRGIRPTVGNDLVLLAELACQGPFALVPEQLFLQRRHAEQFSQQGQAQVQWHAPKASVRFAFPHTMVSVEMARGVLASRIGAAETARALATIPVAWTLPRWRGPAADVWAALGRQPRSQRG
ncbi:glycosyltransferase family 2 protein [Cellulomonas triticagri]|uniref:Glycosyltransferase family 2 protein n=1 Tax=Cellulomonas triticagri TaxID=2483352 RepID=A0A3M2J453_9CELL|nr:glycosyltransferase family 2 protein [Cellulomonas triticagri]RMI06846.1 glycosyltransferase family 2 protein [Cellulomonas triticagri]